MSFNVFENEALMAEFDRISAEPIDDEPYSLVHNPKPVVESILDFNGHKIDTGSWCSGDGVDENKKKVGKAKTASDPKIRDPFIGRWIADKIVSLPGVINGSLFEINNV